MSIFWTGSDIIINLKLLLNNRPLLKPKAEYNQIL